MDQKIPTNYGSLSALDVLDRCMFNSYAAQRDAGCTSERLIPFYDVERFEPIYRAQHGIVPLTDADLDRAGAA